MGKLSDVLSRWMGLALFATSLAGVLSLLWFFSMLPAPIHLGDLSPPLGVACGSAGRPPLEALSLFATQTRWLGFALFLAAVAAIGVFIAAGTLIAIGRECADNRRATVLLSVLGVLVTLVHLYGLNSGHEPATGFLSTLLTTLAQTKGCEDIRAMVWPMRSIGEGPALIIAAAMAATAGAATDAVIVARRIECLQLLLYCASLLFVAGISMSESNFSWITAQWAGYPREEHVGKAIADVVQAGTLQSGVGYSVLLVIFFLPARSYLAWKARQLPPREASQDRAKEQKSREEAGLVGSWRDDLKQILALLAPVLAAPLFDAFVK
jgi:hypothetical protein